MKPFSIKTKAETGARRPGGLLILSLCFPASASAVTWQHSVTLPLSLEYETNPRLSEDNRQSVRRTILQPDYSLTGTQGTEQWFARAKLNIERSSDTSISADREDPLIDLGWVHEYETGQFGLTAHFDKRSTRLSEFEDTGLLVEDNTRRTRSLAVEWRNALSDRYSLAVNADITKVTFDEATADLNEYRNEAISAQLGYSLDEQTESFARLSLSRFDPDTASSETDFRSLAIGITRSLNNRFSISGSAGINDTSGASNESGWQAMLDMEYLTERTRSQFSLSRTRSPSGAGVINEANQVTAGWTYGLSEWADIGVDVNWRENLDANPGQTILLRANYNRQISRHWDFRLSAQHRNRDDEIINASSNSLTASLIYKLTDF
jgi:hypothetical protein